MKIRFLLLILLFLGISSVSFGAVGDMSTASVSVRMAPPPATFSIEVSPKIDLKFPYVEPGHNFEPVGIDYNTSWGAGEISPDSEAYFKLLNLGADSISIMARPEISGSNDLNLDFINFSMYKLNPDEGLVLYSKDLLNYDEDTLVAEITRGYVVYEVTYKFQLVPSNNNILPPPGNHEIILTFTMEAKGTLK